MKVNVDMNAEVRAPLLQAVVMSEGLQRKISAALDESRAAAGGADGEPRPGPLARRILAPPSPPGLYSATLL